MAVTIELFGIPRRRAGVEQLNVDAARLDEALQAAIEACPRLRECLTPDGRLRAGYLVNLNGRMFTTDVSSALQEGDRVILLSADVGG